MIDGVWNSDYVCELGILDHCKEILVLKDHIRIDKSKPKTENNRTELAYAEEQLIREMADLKIILDKYFEERQEYIDLRLKRFAEKANLDCEDSHNVNSVLQGDLFKNV